MRFARVPVGLGRGYHADKAVTPGGDVRIHVIMHAPFEGPVLVAEWAHARGHDVSGSLALTEEFPPIADVDLLVIMGGPMAADDDAENPWLLAEKRFVSEALGSDTMVLGVCLGCQIVAEVAGGAVRRNEHREIGWYPVSLTASGREDPVFSAFPDGLVVGHWHGDTAVLPNGTQPALSSEACVNQAFSMDSGRVVGVQFHLEWTPEALGLLIDACADEFAVGGTYVASSARLAEQAPEYVSACRDALYSLLDRMVALAEVR